MDHIYTRTGDEGMTSIHGGKRVSKTDLRIKANGSIDHLNCTLGVVRSLAETENRYFPAAYNEVVRSIQQELMKIMALIATITPEGGLHNHNLPKEYVERLEQMIDNIKCETNMPAGFVIPGGELVGSMLQLARADARNAELKLWDLNQVMRVDPEILKYFNRLSDLLFVMAVSVGGGKEQWKGSTHPGHGNC